MMPLGLGSEKALPDIPVDDNANMTIAELWLMHSTNKVLLPLVNVENTMPGDGMDRQHELWNVAGLSARAHRRRRRGQNSSPCRIPAPISILDPESISPSLPSADPSIRSTTPATARTRKRWGILSPRLESQGVEKKASNTLGTLRAMARNRLKKKLRYAKSAPNLGDQATQMGRPPIPLPVEVVPTNMGARIPRSSSLPDPLAVPKVALEPEDMDENAIYFTIDPNWRASRGSVQFQFITPIPDSSTSLRRPDSPLLHRYCSLDQSSAATAFTATDFPEAYPGHPIDELHAYLGV